jgi:chlorobactene glucosyltransferase
VAWIQTLAPSIVALPWLAAPLAVLWQLRNSRHLVDYAPAAGPHVPRVSVIVPARNEAHNIERCVRSLCATAYTNVEFIVADDHSSDGTGALAWRAFGDDARARVTVPPPLPAGWFGKQWACAHAASLATGELILFTDADTTHAPDLLPRMVAALRAREADLLSVSGRQETGTFWEKVVQPAIFVMFFAILGGAETMSRSHDPRRKIANGQCLLVRRDVYEALDGHAAVRAYSAEDAMLAMRWTEAGRRVHMVIGLDQLSTRMYTSFAELVAGWEKNLWTAGRHLLVDNAVVRGLARIAAPLGPLIGVVPAASLLIGLTGVVSSWWLSFGAIAYAFSSMVLAVVYRGVRAPPGYALLHPLGSAVIAYISARAVLRGDTTEWKGRVYKAA